MTSARNPVYRIILVRTAQASALTLVLHGVFRWPLTGPHALGLVFTPLLCLYFVFVFVAPWSWGLSIRTRLPTRENVLALTFDDGPSRETTPAILDTLARHGVRATFFVLGESVARHPDLMRRIIAEGHAVGIHGDHHTPFVLLSWKRVGEEIARTRAAIRQACPKAGESLWLRPPHGFKTLTLPWRARRAGCRLVAWTVNARDYQARDARAIAQNVLGAVQPGAIVLLHDGPVSQPTVAALPHVLDCLRERGYRCVLL